VKLELYREKKRYDAEIKPYLKSHKSTEDAIKRQAEADGNMVTERRWYTKIEPATGEPTPEEDNDG
jgi:hypothetical protein